METLSGFLRKHGGGRIAVRGRTYLAVHQGLDIDSDGWVEPGAGIDKVVKSSVATMEVSGPLVPETRGRTWRFVRMEYILTAPSGDKYHLERIRWREGTEEFILYLRPVGQRRKRLKLLTIEEFSALGRPLRWQDRVRQLLNFRVLPDLLP